MAEFNKTIGFIGSGNMARAIIRGMLKVGLTRPEQIWIADPVAEQVAKVKKETGVNAAADNRDLISNSDIVIIATKPYQVADVIDEVKDLLEVSRHLLVSICAGVQTSAIETAASIDVPVVRVMPNTPALIGCGSAAIAGGRNAKSNDLDAVGHIFDSVGTSVVVDEVKLDAVTGLTGSGPAYVFRFIEGLVAAGIAQGLTEQEVMALVPQMVLGAARMAVEDDRSLGELRTAVTTPGGTTAAGLKVLDEGGFLQLMESCVEAATVRSRELAASK